MLEALAMLARTIRTSGRDRGGPVTRSVANSVRRATLHGLVAWNVLMLPVSVVVAPRIPTAALLVLHLALIAAAVATMRDLVRFEITLVLGFGVWMTDYLGARSVDGVLTLAACWLGNLLYVTSAITLRTRARTLLPVLGSVVVVAVIVTASPVWQLGVASAFVVTAIAIVVAARLAMPFLWNLSEQADRNLAAIEQERRTHEVGRRASADASEDARLLHDTVINTLGAVANHGGGIENQRVVRQRCSQDLQVVEELLDGRRTIHRGLRDIARTSPALQVEQVGLVGTDLDELTEVLAPEVTDALVGAAGEALRNVGEHAGVAAATLEIRRVEDGVLVQISDRGRGMGPGSTEGRGIAESIRGRMAAVGGYAEVTSEVGHGTRVSLRSPLEPPSTAPVPGQDPDPAVTAHVLTSRACWLLSAGVVAVGVVIEATNRPGQLTWTYGMLALVAGGVALARVSLRHRDRLPLGVSLVLALALPAGFVLSMAGIDFGRTQVLTYQAIGVAPLLLVLLTRSSTRWSVFAGTATVLAAGALAIVLWQESPTYGAIVVVGVAPALGLGVGWWGFQRLITRIVTESERARAAASATALEAAVQREIAASRQRWGTAGLERAAELLRGIASGELDVASDTVQDACAAEELYLRQLLLLSPAAYRVSAWFAHALAAARARGVRLTIRSGDQDAPDGASARAIGAIVLQAITEAPAHAHLTIGWFPTAAGLRLSIVGRPRPGTAPELRPPLVPATWTCTRQVLATQELVEVLLG